MLSRVRDIDWNSVSLVAMQLNSLLYTKLVVRCVMLRFCDKALRNLSQNLQVCHRPHVQLSTSVVTS